MKLVPNWKRIWRKAWSMRLASVGILLGLADLLIPGLQDVIGTKAFIALFIAVAIARLVYQEQVNETRK